MDLFINFGKSYINAEKENCNHETEARLDA